MSLLKKRISCSFISASIFSILSVIAIFLILKPSVTRAGGIKADQSAPAENQPSLDKAQNGVPVVNIAAPSGSGVSQNKFTEYNVNKEGVILNNNAEAGVSQLGGALYGNPKFQHNKKEADIILNEVTGVTQTGLLGTTEVFGKAAEVIIANPNGIYCNGAGFINTPRVTLSTGTPSMDEFRDIKGIEVEQGMIVLDGSNMDVTGLDHFEIQAKAVRIAAGIRAGKKLIIKAGKYYCDYKDGAITERDDESEAKASGDVPVVGIDASLLGWMTAGKIILIITEKGVGINSESSIAANIEDITITADGRVVYKDAVAKGSVNINAGGDIKQTGAAYAEKDIKISGENIELNGDIVSEGKTGLKAEDSVENFGYIGAVGELNIEAGEGVTNAGEIETASNLQITGKNLDNRAGKITADGRFEAFGMSSVDNRNGIINTGEKLLFEGLDLLNNDDGSIVSNNEIKLRLNTDFEIIGDYYAEGNLEIEAPNIVNNTDLDMQGEIAIKTTSGSFLNNSGKIISSKKGVAIETAGDLENNADINSENDIKLTAAANIRNNDIGSITGGDGETIIIAGGGLYNQSGLTSAKSLDITAAGIENYGLIGSSAELMIETDYLKNNSGGAIYSGEDMTINAHDYIENIKAEILSFGSLKLRYADGINNNRITNNVGMIESYGDMIINTKRLENIGEDNPFDYEKYVEITDRSEIINFAGGYVEKIHVSDYNWGGYRLMDEYVVTSELETEPAYITSEGSLYISDAEIYNYGSAITAGGDLSITGGSLRNETAAISVELARHKRWGKKWTYKHCDDYGLFDVDCETRTAYHNYWKKGEVIAYSLNPALIQAIGSIKIETTELSNEGETGYEEANTESGSNPVKGEAVEVAYNISKIREIGESGIDLSDYAEIKESALYKINEDPGSPYLIETRPEYINSGDFYGSDYFLSRIEFKPDRDVKAKLMADAFYESRIIKRAIIEATAKKYLRDDIKTDAEQMIMLIENAVEAYKNLDLAVGSKLSVEQINGLSKDIYWLVEEEINGMKILVPRIYLSSATLASIESGGSIIKSGGDMSLAAAGEIINTGIITGSGETSLTGKKIINQTVGNGRKAEITGKSSLKIEGYDDIINRGGVISSKGDLSLTTRTGDIINETVCFSEAIAGDIRSKVVSEGVITSEDEITVSVGNDFLNKAAQITAVSDTRITAGNDIIFDSIALRNKTNYIYTDGWGVSDQTKNIGSALLTGGDFALNSGNDITVKGSRIDVSGNAEINAANDFDLRSVTDKYRYFSQTEESGFFSSSTTTTSIASTTNIESRLNISGDLIVNRFGADSRDINIIGSQIDITQNAQLNAGRDFNLMPGYDTSHFEQTVEKSGFFTGGSLYMKELTLDGVGHKKPIASEIGAGGDLFVSTGRNAQIEGSVLTSQNTDITSAGDFTLKSAPEEKYSYHLHEKTSIGLSIPKLQFDQGRLSLTLAKGEYDKEKIRTDTVLQSSSEINTQQDLKITGENDIIVSGSDITAGGDISLAAKKDIKIIPSIESRNTDTQTEHGEMRLSVGVSHEATDLYYAAKGLEASAQQVKEIKTAYDDYKKILEQAETDYKNGVLKKEDYETIKGYQKSYLLAISLAGASFAGKTANMADSIKRAGSTTISGGFEFDLQADLDLMIAQSKKIQTIASPSNITAGSDITIESQENTLINAGRIRAGDSLRITAQNIEISAAGDTYKETSEQKEGHISYGWGLFGGPDAGSIDASMASSDLKTTSYKNAKLTASDIMIISSADTQIKGAQIEGDNLIIDTAGDLSIASLQDTYMEHGLSIGAGVSFKENTSKGASVSFGNIEGKSGWVREQTNLFGADSLTINTGGETDLTGAVISTNTGDLILNTRTLKYSDILDRDYGSAISAQASYTKEKDEDGKSRTQKDFDARLSFTDRLQRNRAVIGEGEIIIRENLDQDLTGLARDTALAQTGTGQIEISIGIDSDISRIFDPKTYEAIAGLPENVIQIGKNIQREFGDLLTSFEEKSEDGVITDFMRKTASREAILKIKDDPAIMDILRNQTDYTAEQIETVSEYIAGIVSKVRLETPPEIEFYNGDILAADQKYTTNRFGQTIDKSGTISFFDPDTKKIFINAANIDGSAKDLIYAVANETSHYIDYKKNIPFDGLNGARETVSDKASYEMTNAWTDQFGTLTASIAPYDYNTWVYDQTAAGAYTLGNYNAGLVTDPQPDMVGVKGGLFGTYKSVLGVLEKSKLYYDYDYTNALRFIHSGILQSTPYKAAKILSQYKHKNEDLKIVWGHSMGADAAAIAYGNGLTYYAPFNIPLSRPEIKLQIGQSKNHNFFIDSSKQIERIHELNLVMPLSRPEIKLQIGQSKNHNFFIDSSKQIERIHELNLVMPRVSIVLENLDSLANKVNVDRVNIFMLREDKRPLVKRYGDRRYETLNNSLTGRDIPSNVNIVEINKFAGKDYHGDALAEDSPVLKQIFEQYKEIQDKAGEE